MSHPAAIEARRSRLGWLVVGGVALAVVVPLALQRQAAAVLTEEVGLLREQNAERERVLALNRQLANDAISDAELQRLRIDHAAVVRLRGEVEALRLRAESMNRAAVAVQPKAAPGEIAETQTQAR